MVSAIFFDFDGTLVDDGEAIYEALDHAYTVIRRHRPDIPRHELLHAYRQSSERAWGDYDRYLRHLSSPEAMLRAVWRETLTHWDHHDPALTHELAESYWSHRLRRCQPYPDVVPLLLQLTDRFQLCLLTNGAPAMQRTKVSRSGLESYFDHIFVGGEFARGKPAPAIFQAALEAADCHPEQAVHIGDSLLHDIVGAQKLGIHGVWLNRKTVRRKDLPAHVSEQLTGIAPEYEIHELSELMACLAQIEFDQV